MIIAETSKYYGIWSRDQGKESTERRWDKIKTYRNIFNKIIEEKFLCLGKEIDISRQEHLELKVVRTREEYLPNTL